MSRMGKEYSMKKYKENRVRAGMIDIYKPNTFWVEFSGHLFCDESQDWMDLQRFYKDVCSTVREFIKGGICKQKFISNLDYSESFNKKTYTYYHMEFTFFISEYYNREKLTKYVNELADYVNKEKFKDSPFKLYAEKKDLKLENQNVYSFRPLTSSTDTE